MKLLDTTFLVDLLRGKSIIKSANLGQGPFLTTQINMYEIITGLFLKKSNALKQRYVQDLFEDIRVLPLDDAAIIKAAQINANLTKNGEIIGDCDSLIAGIALSKGVTTIITKNVKHFKKIKGLKVETY